MVYRCQNCYGIDMTQAFASIYTKGFVARTKNTSGWEKMGELRVIASRYRNTSGESDSSVESRNENLCAW